MAPPAWTTPEELTWLKARIPEYRTKQTESKLWKFWPALKAAWYAQFPEAARLGIVTVTAEGDAAEITPEQSSALTAALIVRNGQLENWFRHHAKKTTTVSAAQSNAIDSLASLLFKPAPRRRPHRPNEVFQKRHPTEVDAALEEAGFYEMNEAHAAAELAGWEDEAEEVTQARIKENRQRRMELRQQVVREMLSKASDDEKNAIDKIIAEEVKELEKQKGKGKGKGKATSDGDDDEEQLKPEDYLRHIDESPEVFAKVQEVVKKMTGWYGFTVYGGPNPRKEGELSMKVVCFGKTPAGLNFQAAHGSFDEAISKPFHAFLRRGFTRAARQARALVPVDTDAVLPSLEGLFRLSDGAPEPTPASAAPKRKTKRVKRKKKTASTEVATAATGSDSMGSASTSSVPPPSALSASVEQWEDGPAPLEDESSDLHDPTSLDFLDAQHSSSTPPPDLGFDSDMEDANNAGDDISLNHIDNRPATTAGSTMWPVGMGPPPSPATANAIALAERGGAAAYDQLIDPALLTTPQRRGASACPAPRPLVPAGGPRPLNRAATWGSRRIGPPAAQTPNVDVAPTVNVLGFNFPTSQQDPPSRLSGLFDTFRDHVAMTPTPPPPSSSPPASSSPAHSSSPLRNTGLSPASSTSTSTRARDVETSRAVAFPRTTARPGGPASSSPAHSSSPLRNTGLSPASSTSTSSRARDVETSRAVAFPRTTARPGGATSVAGAMAAAAKAKRPKRGRPTAAAAALTAALSNITGATSTSTTASAATGAVGAGAATPPPAATPTKSPTAPPNAPPLPVQTSTPVDAPVVPPQTSTPAADAAPAFIPSRPMANKPKPPGKPKTQGAAKKPRAKAAAKKATKSRGAGQGKGKAAAKQPGADAECGSDDDDNVSEAEGEADGSAVAGTAAGATRAPGPGLIYTTINNTSNWNKAVEMRQAAAKTALRAENRRTFNPNGERPLDILPGPPPEERAARARKPVRRFDGSYVEVSKKMTRLELQQEREAAQRERDAERERQESLILPSARKKEAAAAKRQTAAAAKKENAAAKKQTAAAAAAKQGGAAATTRKRSAAETLEAPAPKRRKKAA